MGVHLGNPNYTTKKNRNFPSSHFVPGFPSMLGPSYSWCMCCVFRGKGPEKGEDSSLYVKANQQPSNHILKGVCVFVGVCVPGITEADYYSICNSKNVKREGEKLQLLVYFGVCQNPLSQYRAVTLSISFFIIKNESLDLSKFLALV